MNKTVAIPRVASVIVALSASVPLMYAVVTEQVRVMLPLVLLKIETASPVAKVASGIVMLPPDPTWIYVPTSVVTNV